MSFDADLKMKVRDALGAMHEPEAHHLLATVYWGALLATFIMLAVASLAYGGWEFFASPPEEAAQVNVRQPAVFDRAELQRTLEALDARAVRFEERMRVPLEVRDPS